MATPFSRALLVLPLAGLLLGCAPMLELRPLPMQGDSDPSEDDYAAGKRHLAANQLGLAIERFRARVARDRADLAALNALAASYDRLGRYDLADRYYDQALAQAPDDAQTLNNAGVSQLLRGRPQQALILLNRAEAAAPEDEVVLANVAWARDAEALAAAEADPEESAPPSRIRRIATSVWALTTRMVEPVSFVRPPSRDAAEPPPPLPAPRPAVIQMALPQAAAPARPPAQLKVLNGVGRRGMAGRLRAWLGNNGWSGGSIGDAASFTAAETVLIYRPGWDAEAKHLAALLPPGIRLKAGGDPRFDLVLVLGRDLIAFDQTLSR